MTRRLIYWVLLAFLLISVAAFEAHPFYSKTPPSSSSNLLPIISVGVVLMLLWSVIYLQTEPTLTRVGLGAITLVFLIIFFVYKL
jgi:hypothetical protein